MLRRRLRRIVLRTLHTWGYGLWMWTDDKLSDMEPAGAPCPDCGVPTTVPLDQPCPECEYRLEEKRRDEAIMASAYDQGYDAGRHSREAEGSW